jgi:prepilin-type processing-associated H-X9-DG protein
MGKNVSTFFVDGHVEGIDDDVANGAGEIDRIEPIPYSALIASRATQP